MTIIEFWFTILLVCIGVAIVFLIGYYIDIYNKRNNDTVLKQERDSEINKGDLCIRNQNYNLPLVSTCAYVVEFVPEEFQLTGNIIKIPYGPFTVVSVSENHALVLHVESGMYLYVRNYLLQKYDYTKSTEYTFMKEVNGKTLSLDEFIKTLKPEKESDNV